jgi:hypothetical protein
MPYKYTVTFKTGAVVDYFVPDDGHSSLWDQVDESLVASFVYVGQGPYAPGLPPTPVPPPVVITPPVTGGGLLDLPGEIVQWFRDLWNAILAWFGDIKTWISTNISPLITGVWDWLVTIWHAIVADVSGLITQVWGWIQSAVSGIIAGVQNIISVVWDWIESAAAEVIVGVGQLFNQVYSWLGTGFSALTSNIATWFSSLSSTMTQFATDIGAKVGQINDWFSNEFIDPFVDWLIQFPLKFTASLDTMLTAIGNRLVIWFTHESPGFIDMMGKVWHGIWSTVYGGILALSTGFEQYMALFDKDWLTRPVWVKVIETAEAAVITFLGGWLIKGLFPLIGKALPDLGIWIGLYAEKFGAWALTLLPRLGGWFTGNIINLLGSGLVLTAAATGKLEVLIDKFVTPAIVGVFNQFESLGPISPMSGAGMSTSIGKLATFTIAGLAGMTLAGEMLSPLKHIGLGHVSAIIYDLINYKTLTAAFMGVLAAVYIKTPLTYYYNRAARPMIPREQALVAMVQERKITVAEYQDNLKWYGYPDAWISKLTDIAYSTLSPRMLTSFANAGILDEGLLDHALEHSGYDDYTIPFIKQMMHSLSAGELKVVSSGVAMSRYQEGFDDEPTLRQNLNALGVAPGVLNKYVFAAQLKYLYDYQTDLKTYYIDAYHRRAIEEPELRSNLAASGLLTDRIDLVVQAQKIKRLGAAAPESDPALSVQFDTVRDRRKKSLITRAQEIDALIALGYELPYATAIADNDDVAMTPSGAVIAPVVLKQYETEAGKIEVDTIRRLARSRQIEANVELQALTALAMPVDLAQAIVDNDSLRLIKQAAAP